MLDRSVKMDEFPAMQMVRTGNIVRICARVTFLLLVTAIIGLVFLPWRQTARGTGTVMALDPQQRPQPVLSPSKGVVSWVKDGLREGSYVEEGDLVLKMTPFAAEGVSQLDTQIIAMKSNLTAAENSLEVAKQNVILQASSGRSMEQSLDQEFKAAQQKFEQALNEVTALRAELQDKENKLRIAQEVAKRGLESAEELYSKRRGVDTMRAKLEKAQNAVNELSAITFAKESEILAKKESIAIKNREADQKVYDSEQKVNDIETKILDLERKRGELARLEVPAPRSGYIQQWYGLEGSGTIKEGDQLFVIVPDADELSVEMKVSGNDMPLIHEGDKVRLQFEGWPAVQFVGWPSVAVGTFGGKVNRVFPTDDGKGFFRVIVTPDNHFKDEDGWPDDNYLRQGVRANGWVLLKEVPLGYEIWRQLNGFPPVVADDEPNKSKEKDKGSKVKLPKM